MIRASAAVVTMVLVSGCVSLQFEAPALRAFGNEPFWNVAISAPDSIVYERLGEASIRFPYDPSKYVEGDSTMALGPLPDATGEHQIEIQVVARECQDTMADVVHPMQAYVTIDGERLSGCARFLDPQPVSEVP